MGIFVETISKMKESMFEHLKDAEHGVYDTVKFEVPVEDLVRLEQEAIKFEREKEQLREAFDLKTEVHDKLNKDYIKVRDENKRLREALEFYANESNYEDVMTELGDIEYSVDEHRGSIARKALGMEELK